MVFTHTHALLKIWVSNPQLFNWSSLTASLQRLRTHLFVGEALLSEDLQQRSSVAVSPLEHLPDDGQKVPDALWLATPQRSQQARPLSSGGRLGRRQVHRVHIAIRKQRETGSILQFILRFSKKTFNCRCINTNVKGNRTRIVYLKTTGEGPQNLCSVFLMLSLRVDSSKYQVL